MYLMLSNYFRQDILSQIFDVIQSDVALKIQVHLNMQRLTLPAITAAKKAH